MATPMPVAWSDLIEGLTILAQHPANEISPLHCEHDMLLVCADEALFTDEEKERLEIIGFEVDDIDGGFFSYRFGSA
jgi:hypothetical protein